MILLIHSKATTPIKVLKDGMETTFAADTCASVFWELAEKFPEELICWCGEEFVDDLNLNAWKEFFHHNLIMASYAIKNKFFPNTIGYIDQLPFINVNRSVSYGTWQMSSDVGGIKGEVLLKFKPLFGKIENFTYLLNSVAKIGQQNGLFCYSEPKLISRSAECFSSEAEAIEASTEQLFSFVYQFYKTSWVWVLLWCYLKYEKQFPVFPALKSVFKKKLFLADVDLSGVRVQSRKEQDMDASIDVIIPTMGRSEYLLQVLKDLGRQTLLPKKVIVVEQNPESNSKSDLSELDSKSWPFEIKHHFIHQTGACNARNMALREVSSEWVFFADDDIRLKPDVLAETISELQKLGALALNINCKQIGEETVFKKIKQWGSFGSGTSMVKSAYAKKCSFSSIFEHGYGEDTDFGMQLRNKGCDIIYNPNIEILHLKAPMGGFRRKPVLPWEKEKILPKPSPTVLAYAFRYYTLQQIKGFKTSLFLKYYARQEIKNPITYIRQMKKRWKKSEEWAEKLAP